MAERLTDEDLAAMERRYSRDEDISEDFLTLLAEVRTLRAQVESLTGPYQREHVVRLSRDGWTPQHSTDCRAAGRLHDCDHTAWCQENGGDLSKIAAREPGDFFLREPLTLESRWHLDAVETIQVPPGNITITKREG